MSMLAARLGLEESVIQLDIENLSVFGMHVLTASRDTYTC